MKRHHNETNDNIEAEHRLYEAIAALRTVDEVAKFFEDLCTPTERQALSDRWNVVEPIKAGVPYRTIYDQTGVSVTTIGRVARCLTSGSGGYDLARDRLRKTNANKRKAYPGYSEKGETKG